MEYNLIRFCRYYKGENEPMSTHPTLWEYEKRWVELNETQSGKEMLADYIDDYSRVGLSQFEAQDDTPASLKALLFYRFCYWNSGSSAECVEPFKQWYIETYIKGGS